MNKLWNVIGILILVCLNVGAAPREEEFLSEASGVCRLGDSLVIAGDENPDSLWVIDGDSQTIKSISVKNGEWDDLEDLSAVDDRRFFAMTSHSRTKKGKLKPERGQLLLISKKKSSFAVEQTWSLREDILSALEESVDVETAEAASPDEGGLNVEGLAYHEGQLFLGLRSPLTDKGEALVLRIENAEGLLEGDDPEFGEVIRLPLGKKGIRGLTSTGSDLLVIAGASDDSGKTFSLYRWAPSSKKAELFSLPGFADLIRPEALVAEKDGSYTFVQDFEEPTDQEVVVNLFFGDGL